MVDRIDSSVGLYARQQFYCQDFPLRFLCRLFEGASPDAPICFFTPLFFFLSAAQESSPPKQQLGLTQLMPFCVGADDSLPENILYKGLKLPLRAA